MLRPRGNTMRRWLGHLGHLGLCAYSSDAVFTAAANLAAMLVLMLVLLWLVLAFGPRPPADALPASAPPTECSYLAGRCG